MLDEIETYDKATYIETSTGNRISLHAKIIRPQSVEIPMGKCIIKPYVMIRGDFAPVQLNKYTIIREDTILRPSYTSSINSSTATTVTSTNTAAFRFIPLTIGSHCSIGKACLIEAASIGQGCIIEDDCILLARCVLKDYVHVLKGTVIPPDMILPPFAIVSGNPAKITGEMPPSSSTFVQNQAINRYKSFVSSSSSSSCSSNKS